MHPGAHDHAGHIFRLGPTSRRALLIDLGGMAAAAVILGGCTSGDSGDEAADDDTDDEIATDESASTTETVSGTTTLDGASPVGRWEQVDLGFVSAYVLVRAGEAVIVDSGPAGSETAIAETLEELGSGWSDVSDVIVTHRHADHVGSLPALTVAAAQAALWAGIDDVDAIGRDLGITGVGDGEQIAGLSVIATPGHTPGHISVLDRDAGVLVAGDALNGENGGVVGPNSRFTPDMETADASVGVLAGFDYHTIYFGHGEPVFAAGADLVAALAAG